MKYPSTDALRHVIAELKRIQFSGTLEWAALPKLHGTNASVRFTDQGEIVSAYSRNQKISVENDNAGFAAFVEENQTTFATMAFDVWKMILLKDSDEMYRREDYDIRVFGEWCGEGIQKGTAVNELPKHFAVFAVGLVPKDSEELQAIDSITNLREFSNMERLFTNPENQLVAKYINQVFRSNRVSVLNGEIPAKELNALQDYVSEMTERVEKECPYARDMAKEYGISLQKTVGEGLVWMPVSAVPLTDNFRYSLRFKTKGLAHKQQSHSKAKVEVDPEVSARIQEMVNLLLPQWRLEQGVAEACSDNPTMKETGAYLKWVHQDILKEESDRIKKSDFEWKQLQKAITDRARQYFSSNAA